MTPEQFCYWLQGFSELRVGTAGPTDGQWASIADHLATVFTKVTPPRDIGEILRNAYPEGAPPFPPNRLGPNRSDEPVC